MRSPSEHLKHGKAARPIYPVGPLPLAAPTRGLTHSRPTCSDAPMRSHQGVCPRSIQSHSRCVGTSEATRGLAAATS